MKTELSEANRILKGGIVGIRLNAGSKEGWICADELPQNKADILRGTMFSFSEFYAN